VSTSAPVATFAIQLRDETSGPANEAAGSLDRLRDKIQGDTKALGDMQAALRRLKGGTTTSSTAFRELQQRIAAQRAAVAEAQARYVDLGGTFGAVARASAPARDGLTRILEVSQRMPGPLGGMVGQFGALRGLLAGGPLVAAAAGFAAALVAVGVALVGVTVAVASAAATLTRYAIAQGDARRSEQLRLEGLAMLRQRQGLAVSSGAELQASLDRVSDGTALGREQLVGYTEQLHRMGLRGPALETALEGVAIAASTQGERVAQRFAYQAAAAARFGGSVEALTGKIRSRLGGLAARHLLAFDVQVRRLRQDLGRIFANVSIDRFLAGMREVLSLFSQTTATGRALQTLASTWIQPIVDGIAAAAPIARRFFQGLVIAALQFTISVLQVRNRLREAFGGQEMFERLDLMGVALAGGRLAFDLIAAAVMGSAAAFLLLGAAIGVVVAGVAVMMAPFIAGVAAVVGFGAAVFDLFQRALAIDWAAIGRSMIDGLVNAITGGISWVVSAVRRLASSATEAITSALQIRSPSRVFAELGRQIPAGLAVGVESASGLAAGAVEDLSGVSDVGAGGASGGLRGGGPVSISIGDIHVNAQGAGSAREVAEALREELARILEGVAAQMGAPA